MERVRFSGLAAAQFENALDAEFPVERAVGVVADEGNLGLEPEVAVAADQREDLAVAEHADVNHDAVVDLHVVAKRLLLRAGAVPGRIEGSEKGAPLERFDVVDG